MIYLALLTGALVFYWAYRQWLSWLLLMGLLLLPWFSLLCSLPAMLTCILRPGCVRHTMAGTVVPVSLIGKCELPVPHVKSELLAVNAMTGAAETVKNEGSLPTTHCGLLEISLKRTWIYDYLGLLRLPVFRRRSVRLLVRPQTVAVEDPPDMSRYLANAWKPKTGGGFSENHELRLYRPGDSLKQVHWKLSAKTGKLVYREPMEALRGKAVLTMHLSGTPEVLDDKLGRLHFMSLYLLERDIPHSISCLTGNGLISMPVHHEQDALAVQAKLLASPAAPADAPGVYMEGSWRYHVGGPEHA